MRRRGHFRCGVDFEVSSCFPHAGEEPELLSSGTVFACGCSMRCILCRNWEVSRWREEGAPYAPVRMAEVVELLKDQVRDG